RLPAEEEEEPERGRQEEAAGDGQKVARGRAQGEEVAHGAPGHDPEDSAGGREDAEPEAGLFHREALYAVEVEREPVVERADVERDEHPHRADRDEGRRPGESDEAGPER